MRTVTRRKVLEAADWCAERCGHWTTDYRGVDYRQEAPSCWLLVQSAEAAAYEANGANGVELAAIWADASSILYAAALEGGPMPDGWEMTP